MVPFPPADGTPTVYVASRVLVGMRGRPDGYPLEEILVSPYPQDAGLPLAAPVDFVRAMNFLIATGDVVEKDGRFLPSSSAAEFMAGLPPKVGIGEALEKAVESYLHHRRPARVGDRFRPDDPEVKAAYAVFAVFARRFIL